MDLIKKKKKKNLNAAFYSDEALFTELIFPDPVCTEPSANLSKHQQGSKAFQVVLPQHFRYQKNVNMHKLTRDDSRSCN